MTTAPETHAPASPVPAPRPVARKAIGPRLRVLLYVVFGLLALLVANSCYLSGITLLEYASGKVYQDYFYQVMLLAHLVLGLVFIGPFVVFGLVHMVNTWNRKKRRAVNIGYALFAACLVVLVTGLLLMRLEGLIDLRNPLARRTMYWLHVVVPLACVWLYWLHRLSGPRIRWRLGLGFMGAVMAAVLLMVGLRYHDPRQWYIEGPASGAQYFEPSLARTTNGKWVNAQTFMMDDYCLKCHADIYQGWYHSAHRFSSFNNPVYLASIRETREVALKRDGNVQASRWCAGCHDPVPFLSGAFDDPQFDLVNHPTSQAGITCTVCHAMTHVNSTLGNGDYTIEEPLHYPFATSTNPVLQYINNQMVKAKPGFHNQTFLKPFHRTAEFCSVCHKVHLPKEVTHYKEFLRGQNHYDTYLLSGVSGHGARSFYYPEKAKSNCAACHMPLAESADFGAKNFDGSGKLSVHDHLFPAANTALGFFGHGAAAGARDSVAEHAKFLKDSVRIDIFGVKADSGEGRPLIEAPLVAPLRPEMPSLEPGRKYLLEAVVRTLKLGHPLTQGTVDSNEIWVDITVRSGDRMIGRSGGLDEKGEVDKWAHFLNVFMLDRHGNRISRRNAQDIFVPLYNHQIPPGAAAVVHYEFTVPAGLTAPVTVEARVRYRKFDYELMAFTGTSAQPGDHPVRDFPQGKESPNVLPIVNMASDTAVFPVAGLDAPVLNAKVEIPLWQRWNDYGIGLLLEGTTSGPAKGELRQAAGAFAEVEKLKRYDGPLNLARVYEAEGRYEEAIAAVGRAAACSEPPPPSWTMAWLAGRVNRQLLHYPEAESHLKSVLENRTPEMIARGFDFSRDYEVRNELGLTYFQWATYERSRGNRPRADELLQLCVATFEKTLAEDAENVTAHYNLQRAWQQLDNADKASHHRMLHARYKGDDNARDFAVRAAREKYPWANAASEALVIYALQRDGAPELTGLPSARTSESGE